MALIYYTNDILLIWQDEQVYEDLAKVWFCEVYRNLVVWGISGHPFQSTSKGQMIAHPITGKEVQCQNPLSVNAALPHKSVCDIKGF